MSAARSSSLGVQVHGGMGYIEETGAAQHFRDARIAAIYEGTNGIQAIDLVTRKLPMSGGDAVRAYIGELRRTADAVKAANDPAFGATGARLADAIDSLERATEWLLKEPQSEAALAGATPYLRMFANAAGGALLAEQALAAARMAGDGSAPARIALARFLRGEYCGRGERPGTRRDRWWRQRDGQRGGIGVNGLPLVPPKRLSLSDADTLYYPSRLPRSPARRPVIRNGRIGCARSSARWPRTRSSRWCAPRRRLRASTPSRSAIRWTTSTAVQDASPQQGLVQIDADTSMSPGSFEAALRGAGGAVHAVDEVMTGKATNAFVAVRPPGHHAETARPMGFCLFNNAAIAARHAQRKHGAERAAVVDFDVHHGNGSQDIFWSDAERAVFLDPPDAALSRHRRGRPRAASTTPSSTRRCGRATAAASSGPRSRPAILPRLRDFKPDLVVISAGFDAHTRDPLANLNLVEADFAWATQQLMEIADKSAQGRVVSVLEGGYDLAGPRRLGRRPCRRP